MTTTTDFNAKIPFWCAVLAFALTPVARADVDYWRDLIHSARDAGAVRVLEVQAQAKMNDRPAKFSADLLGPAADLGETGGAVVWQLGGFLDDESDRGGVFGLQYRFPPSDGRVAGINAYADYHREEDFGHFWRWSAGAEYRSPWADIFANYYFPMDSRRSREEIDENKMIRVIRGEVAEGYDAELRLHSPDFPWFSAVGGWANWNAARDDGENRRGLRYGVRLSPVDGVMENTRFSLIYDDSRPDGEKVGVDVSVYFVIGDDWEFARARDAEAARMHFRPAQREQRVFLREY